MFELFILIAVFYIFKRFSKRNNLIEYKLNSLFESQNFSNISRNTTLINGITLITGNSHGENYLFAIKNNNYPFSMLDINTIYEIAQKLHIHNPVILTLFSSFPSNILNKLKEYNIQIWDYKKIEALTLSHNTTSVLSTSNTSDDTCKIEPNQFEPIQEPPNFWKSLFEKPDRL